ncbi:MAG: hypothetical protein HKN87_00395 [Saprospiraceae bacterium]|nr:hypothetical protein [Saprospiraceae bacterium]
MSERTLEIFAGLDQLDKKSVSFLLKAIKENNLPGFDYLEFKQSLNGLQKMDMDETTAIKSAFTTGSTVGLTKSKLISSAEHYRSVIEKEKGQFDHALKKQMSQRVHGKKEEKEKLTHTIQSYQQKIKTLETEILKHKEKLDRADSEINAAKAKIEETRDKFEDTVKSLLGQIDGDIHKLKEVL